VGIETMCASRCGALELGDAPEVGLAVVLRFPAAEHAVVAGV
jgi:hypothetical protein